MHSVLNPVIYSFLSYGYRARLVKLWQKLKGCMTCLDFITCPSLIGASRGNSDASNWDKSKDTASTKMNSRDGTVYLNNRPSQR